AVLLLAFGGSADPATGPVVPSPPALEGSWELQSASGSGIFVKTVYTFRDGRFTVTGSLPEKGTYTTDPGQDPAHLDLFPEEGPFKGTHWRWIYCIDGDTLRVASTRSGTERPTGFEGDGLIVLILRRVQE